MVRQSFVKVQPGSRMYGVRLLHEGRQALSDDARWALVLDFTPGGPAAGTQAKLDAALRRLLEQVRNIRAGELGRYYLEVSVWDDPNSVVCHIPVTWDSDV